MILLKGLKVILLPLVRYPTFVILIIAGYVCASIEIRCRLECITKYSIVSHVEILSVWIKIGRCARAFIRCRCWYVTCWMNVAALARETVRWLMDEKCVKNFFCYFLSTQRQALKFLKIERFHAVTEFHNLTHSEDVVMGKPKCLDFRKLCILGKCWKS